MVVVCFFIYFFFKQKTAYEMRISDWSSDVCSSDLVAETLLDRLSMVTRTFPRTLLIGAHDAVLADRLRATGTALVLIEAGPRLEIGRASCRERECPYVSISVGGGSLKKKQ